MFGANPVKVTRAKTGIGNAETLELHVPEATRAWMYCGTMSVVMFGAAKAVVNGSVCVGRPGITISSRYVPG